MNSKAAKQVKALYLEQMELLEQDAEITAMGIDEINKKIYQWIQLDVTIFHPKGGGQPCDEGTIQGVPVAYVHKNMINKEKSDQFEILHCFEESRRLDYRLGQKVKLKIDGSKRKLHSRLHTAGHLIAESVNTHFPKLEGFQGNHYPNNCYVKFKMHSSSLRLDKDEIKEKVQAQIQKWIEQDIVVLDEILSSGLRTVQITKEKTPCGGTHVKNLREVGSVFVSDISINKDKIVTVKYTLQNH